jgi:phosphoribosylaminoimidazolecarboxamide formyltransferase/IMP cyclohydrolase
VIEVLPVRRALLAVAEKSGLLPFARELADRGVELVSTGNTAATLREAGIPVTAVSDVTGFPEMLGGRVKTLHPKIHGGLLADKENPGHLEELRQQGIEPFDLVVVNLYPFSETVAAGASPSEVVEQIDIGGPAMVRASAKNHGSVAVVVSPAAYGRVLEELEREGGITRQTRVALAREAFLHTAGYDQAISGWFAEYARASESVAPAGDASSESAAAPETMGEPEEDLPGRLGVSLVRAAVLRYGENPHQRGGLYATEGGPGPLGGAEVLQGKEMSYNNWLDAEATRAVAGLFPGDRPMAVIVKHHNPCGVAMGPTLAEAYERALDGDRVSAFGGIVAFNGEVDEAAARAMAPVFTEVVIAPSYTDEALAAFGEKKNMRVVRAPLPGAGGLEIRPIDGGALVQDMDVIVETTSDMKAVTSREPTLEQWDDLLFAWKVAARAKSNAIVLVKDLATVAVGAGQMNRVTSVEIAVRHAGEKSRGACLASDAFFPFRDGVDRAGEAGVAAIIQPGGSVRDEEVVAAAEEHGMAMVFTGRRHFRH